MVAATNYRSSASEIVEDGDKARRLSYAPDCARGTAFDCLDTAEV
jgi:hypothetical protein